MGFDVSNFRSNGPRFGLARPTLFKVELQFPQIIDDTEQLKRDGSFLCQAAQLPASIVDAVEVGYFGRKIKLQGDRVFQDWTVTIMNDEDFKLRDAFEAWHNAINGIIRNTLDPAAASIVPGGGGLGGSYKVDAHVTQFAKTGPGESDSSGGEARGAIKSYKFDGLFPTSVDAIQVDWNATNQYETFDVTFAYDWWEPQRNSAGSSIFRL